MLFSQTCGQITTVQTCLLLSNIECIMTSTLLSKEFLEEIYYVTITNPNIPIENKYTDYYTLLLFHECIFSVCCLIKDGNKAIIDYPLFVQRYLYNSERKLVLLLIIQNSDFTIHDTGVTIITSSQHIILVSNRDTEK